MESSKRANFEIVARHAAHPSQHQDTRHRASASGSMGSSPDYHRLGVVVGVVEVVEVKVVVVVVVVYR